MQTPFEVTVDLKLVVHANNAIDAREKVEFLLKTANYPGASAIFAVLGAHSLKIVED